MRRHILVTGATGGLGGAVVRELLARGHRVRATGRRDGTSLSDLGAEFMPADLACSDLAPLLDGIDSVVHAAALSASWGADAAFEEANVTATRRLLDVCGKASRFVFISSPSIFAAFHDRPLIGEEAEAHPLSSYARTKLQAEQLVRRWDTAMARCVIRPRALVGPGDRVVLPKLAELARRPRMLLPRGGRALVELTDMRDAVWAVCEAEERAPAISGAAINISGGHSRSVQDVALALSKALGGNSRLVPLSMCVAWPLALLAEAAARIGLVTGEPVLTRYTLATLAYTQTFDQKLARRLLGYVPRHDALKTLLWEARRMAQQ